MKKQLKQLKNKLKSLKKHLPEAKAHAKKIFFFLYSIKEFALLVFVAYRIEELHAKLDFFTESLSTFLFMFYTKVADSIEFTQAVFMHFLRLFGIES